MLIAVLCLSAIVAVSTVALLVLKIYDIMNADFQPNSSKNYISRKLYHARSKYASMCSMNATEQLKAEQYLRKAAEKEVCKYHPAYKAELDYFLTYVEVDAYLFEEFPAWLNHQEKAENADGIKFALDSGAYPPVRAHKDDAGIDLRCKEGQVVPAKESATFDTGTHVEIPMGYVGFIKSKSGLNCKHGLTADGVIDAGYTGSIVVKLYNHSGYDYTFNAGDKLAQLVILPIDTSELVQVEELGSTERGNDGFGSTGK